MCSSVEGSGVVAVQWRNSCCGACPTQEKFRQVARYSSSNIVYTTYTFQKLNEYWHNLILVASSLNRQTTTFSSYTVLPLVSIFIWLLGNSTRSFESSCLTLNLILYIKGACDPYIIMLLYSSNEVLGKWCNVVCMACMQGSEYIKHKRIFWQFNFHANDEPRQLETKHAHSTYV